MATKVAKEDFKFLNPGGAPDPDFSPERNRQVIARTIAKYQAMKRAKAKEYRGKVEERADAAATYLKHIDQGNSTSVENYFGKQELARLRGQRILMRVLDKRNKMYKMEEVN